MTREPVKSAARALEILELFAEVRRPLALHEVVTRLSYPQSSTTKLLKSIVDLGYLHYDRSTRAYFPTMKLCSISEYLRSSVDRVYAGVMSALHSYCGETIMIANQNDLYVQYVKVLASSHVIRFNIAENSMRPLIESSLGLMLLSTQEDNAIERIYKQSVGIGVRPRSRSFAHFIGQIETCRVQGYCYLRGVPLVGGGSVSMLLPSNRGSQALVLAAGGVCDRLELKFDGIIAEMQRLISSLSS